jgi:hypothetical protein
MPETQQIQKREQTSAQRLQRSANGLRRLDLQRALARISRSGLRPIYERVQHSSKTASWQAWPAHVIEVLSDWMYRSMLSKLTAERSRLTACFIRTYTRTYTHVSYVHTHVYTRMFHTYIHTYIHACFIRTYTRTYTYVSYVHTHVYTRMFHTYIHTYIHVAENTEKMPAKYIESAAEAPPLRTSRSWRLCSKVQSRFLVLSRKWVIHSSAESIVSERNNFQ